MTEYHCILCNREIEPDEHTLGHLINKHNINPDHARTIEKRVIKTK